MHCGSRDRTTKPNWLVVSVLIAVAAAGARVGRAEDPSQPPATQGASGADAVRPLREAGPQPAEEESPATEESGRSWSEWEYAAGDWAGGRTWLEDHGLTFEISYTADFFYNLSGGVNTSDAEQYRGLLGVGLSLDTGKMGLWEGGTAFVSMFENHGTDITERHVGDLQAVNNADAPNRTRLYEFWYEQALFDGALRIKLGKMDANADFAAPDYAGEFIHSSSGFSPTIPLPTWPDPALGFAVFAEPVDWFYLRAGVYDALASGTRGGFDTAFHSPDESFMICELGFRPKLSLLGQEGLPGTYRVGGFYHSGEWDVYRDDLGGRLPGRAHRGNSGLYVVFDQLLYREPPAVKATAELLASVPAMFSSDLLEDEDDQQGLGAFFQFSWVPSDYNEITHHYGGGVQYVGLIPERDNDVVGIAVHHITLAGMVQSLEERYSETSIEMFYMYQLTDFMSIKPDLQYIVNPGGDGRDAIVAGVRLEMSF